MHGGPPMTRSLSLIVLLLGAAACGAPATSPKSAPAPGGGDILAANLDPSVDPGVDFFAYANGTWLANNPIPPSESSWTIGHLVNEELYTIKRKLSEDCAAAGAAKGSDQQKIGDFWATAMDEDKANALGAAPLKERLAKIDAVASPADAVRVAADLQRDGVEVFWSSGVDQDPKQSDLIAVLLYQGGLGLPERDYYFNTEAGVAKVRADYPHHVARMLVLLGQDHAAAEKAGQAVLEFETALAKASRTLEALRDPYANYNKMSVADL